MSSADWDEIRRLAADFQKAQLSITCQKLSERNIVEIINKLIEKNLLNVIFTIDGKEYVTPQHLIKEIKDELYIHGGRVNLVDLAKTLNVDLSQISKAAADIEKHEKKIKLILGKLLDQTYIFKISEEINEKLLQNGYINIAELTLHYDLPAEFLQSVIEKELGRTIQGKQDSQDARMFYNESYIARNEAKIRGALSAITKPTPLSAILGQCAVPERIFFSIVESMREIPGTVTGKQSSNGIYVPYIYSKNQSEWVDSFYKQNGYLEYDALTRLGISDAKNFVKRHFPNENLILLDTVSVGSVLIDQVDANIDEVVATASFSDLYPLLPSVFSPEDVEILIKKSLDRLKSPVQIFLNTVVVSNVFLQNTLKNLETLVEKLAKDAVDSGKWMQSVAENKLKFKSSEALESHKGDKKADRRKKAASGKAGGGSQGRETKTKSTKKKYLQGKHVDDDFDNEESNNFNKAESEFVTLECVKGELEKNSTLVDMDEFVDELAVYCQPVLNKQVTALADKLSQKHKTINLNEIEDRLNALIMNIRVFDKGIRILDKNNQGALVKYLLKSLCSDLVTEIFKLAAQQNVVQYLENPTPDTRQKMLVNFPEDVRSPLFELHKALAANDVETLLQKTEDAMAACCLILKKFDKKKERGIVVGHREAIIEQLNNAENPALVLHLCTAVLFIAATQHALHMSGRHVSAILAFLKPYLQEHVVESLTKYHDLVLQFLSSSDEAVKEDINKHLLEDMQNIKSIASDHKKSLRQDKIADS